MKPKNLCYNYYIMLTKVAKNKLGFTLVELLVVIAIIGILSTATVVNLRTAKAKARDAKRLAEVMQITKAVELFSSEKCYYPNTNCHNLPSVVLCTSRLSSGNWIPELVTEFAANLPDDPLNANVDGEEYFYWFTRDAGTGNPADYFYILFNLEVTDRIDNCNNHPYGTTYSCMGGGELP